MLGIPLARAFLAGAALLAGAHTRTALADGPDPAEEVAFAVPRVRPPADGDTLEIPRPLGPSDARRLRRVFALQESGDIPAALAVAPQINDPLLLGHVLADRFLRPDWKGAPAELAAWLSDYADLPDAPAVWARYAAVAPKGATLPPAPAGTPPLSHPLPDSTGVTRNPVLDRAVQARVRAGQFDAAIRLLARTKGLDPAYAGLLGAELAQSLFFANRDAEALETAEAAFRRGHGRPALAAFVAGLSSWRLDEPGRARTWFEAAWRAPDADRALRSATAFWAARAEERAGTDPAHDFWLARAAREPGTFYGEIARRVAGLRSPLPSPERMVLSAADVALVDAMPAGHRAFALLQVGQTGRAEAELRRLWGATRDTPGMGRAIALVAGRAGLDDLSAALLAVLADEQDPSTPVPATLPLPRLRPTGGFRVDQALVYGVARVESNFDAAAISPVGATGLMQLMPVTATYFAGGGKRVPPALVSQMLHDPGGNLRLGQSYLLFLADALDGDLLRMLAAYNTGLSGFGRWNTDIRHMDDPLMYIESIPVTETRVYVSRALFFTWGYAARLGLRAPSLDDLAAGEWPRFTVAQATGEQEPRPAPARLH